MQKDGRKKRRLNRELETIGFAIYEVSWCNFTPTLKLLNFYKVTGGFFSSKMLMILFYRSQIRFVSVQFLNSLLYFSLKVAYKNLNSSLSVSVLNLFCFLSTKAAAMFTSAQTYCCVRQPWQWAAPSSTPVKCATASDSLLENTQSFPRPFTLIRMASLFSGCSQRKRPIAGIWYTVFVAVCTTYFSSMSITQK